MKLVPREAQLQVLADVSAAFRAGHKRVMVSAACGFGKSEVATAMLQAVYENGKRGAFIADRRALVEQISERFDKYELPHGILMADHARFRPSQQIQACSAQTLARRGQWPDVNLIVVDEAHILSETVKKKLAAKDCYAIGLSATAITRGLGKYFDVVVNAPPTNRLIEQGLLVPFRVLEGVAPDMTHVAFDKTGEWEKAEAEKKCLEVIGDVVSEYLANGGGKQFIGFAQSITHAKELQRKFLEAGINVATYTADDKPEDRSDIVQEFKRPGSNIRGIFSVEALTRGFDCPHVEVLIMARPLRKAAHVFIQMLGRVLRSCEGKTQALVLDHSMNTRRFYTVWNEVFEHGVTELDDGSKKPKQAAEKKEVKPMLCPKCRTLHKPMPHCPNCGHEYERKAAIQHIPGTLKELIAGGHQRELTRDLFPMVAHYVINTRGREGEAARRMAQALFRDITGDFARASWENVKPVAPTPEVINRIRAVQIRFAKDKQAAERRAPIVKPMPSSWGETREARAEATT